jgi:adenosylmethionine-8-amino-7-oxononanoate aminotransferase
MRGFCSGPGRYHWAACEPAAPNDDMTDLAERTSRMRQSSVNPLFTLDPSRNYPTLVRGEGVYLYDDQGRKYLDAIAGIAVMSVGYGRQEIVNAMADQAGDLPYVASNVFSNAPAIRLTQRMVKKIPHLCASVHLTSGGSEAVETGIKICRQYFYDRGINGKTLVISRWTSYHGATLGALSATGHSPAEGLAAYSPGILLSLSV